MHLHSGKTFAINKEICINAENQNTKASFQTLSVDWQILMLSTLEHQAQESRKYFTFYTETTVFKHKLKIMVLQKDTWQSKHKLTILKNIKTFSYSMLATDEGSWYLRRNLFWHVATVFLQLLQKSWFSFQLPNTNSLYLHQFQIPRHSINCLQHSIQFLLVTCLCHEIVGAGNPEALQDNFRLK